MSNFEVIINPPVSPIAFHIAGYPVRFYGIIISVSILAGYFLINYLLKKHFSQSDGEKFSDYVIYLLIFSFFGARLFYVTGSFNFYLNNPTEIIMLNHGGISIWGGLIFGIIALLILSKIYKFSFFKHISVFALTLPLCQAIGRFGNYFNQEAFGAPSNSFIKLFVDISHRPYYYIDNAYFHPAFLYESILNLIIFLILLKTFDKNCPQKTFYLYLILYSVVRITIEAIRLDSVLNIASVHIASIISFIALIFGLIGLIRLKHN